MAKKGQFHPHNPAKYRGNPTTIVFRSSWELKFMRRLDADPRVTEWGSETIYISYFDPSAGRKRRYYPDFKAVMNGKTFVFEVKPYKQTIPPENKKRRQRKTVLLEAATYITNQAKWEAARKYCDARGWTFKILTEVELCIPK